MNAFVDVLLHNQMVVNYADVTLFVQSNISDNLIVLVLMASRSERNLGACLQIKKKKNWEKNFGLAFTHVQHLL